REEIVELGTRYSIVTPYTSYLVLEPGAQARNFAPGRGGGGGSADRVVVQGAGEVLQSQSANISTTLTPEQVKSLPRSSASPAPPVGEMAGRDSKQKAEQRDGEKIELSEV